MHRHKNESGEGQDRHACSVIHPLPSLLSPNDDDAGHKARADKATLVALASSSPNDDAGQQAIAKTANEGVPVSSTNGGGADHTRYDSASKPVVSASSPTTSSPTAPPPADIAPIISQIRYQHRLRCFHMEQRKRSDLSLGAFLRMQLGWSKALPKQERDHISNLAQTLIATGEAELKGKPADTTHPAYVEWRETILATVQSRAPHDKLEDGATKELERLAASLPAWIAFGEGVRGFGARSLGIIVGEAGDLAAYPKKGHLWKRMGLAVIDGVRQGGLRKNASKDDWIRHGYNRERRSRMFVIGENLAKKAKDGSYREAFVARKEYERARATVAGLTVAPAAKIPAKRASEFISNGHIDRRAQRYVEKMFLRDLWVAWRRAGNGNQP